MVLVISHFENDYWFIHAVGTRVEDYENSLQPGQRIIADSGETWPEGNWIKEDLLWDDNLKKVIRFPADLKLKQHKANKLKELEDALCLSNRLSDQTVQTIAAGIKAGKDITEVDNAFKQLATGVRSVVRTIINNA